MTKKQKAALDNRIARIYGERCDGVQISVLDTVKVYQVAYQAIANDSAAAADDTVLGNRIAAFVETIRLN